MQDLQGETLGIRTVPRIGTVRVAATAVCSYCIGGRCGPDKFYVYVSGGPDIQIVCSNCGAAWTAEDRATWSNAGGDKAVGSNGHEQGELVPKKAGR